MSNTILSDELRRALANLHNLAYLEDHPLAHALPAGPGEPESRGLRLRATLIELIECLRPGGEVPAWVPEWRRYVILHEHYVLRQPMSRVEQKLSLGERQVRREQRQALAALAVLLQARLEAPDATRRELPAPQQLPSTVQETVQRLSPAPRPFALAALVEEVAGTLARIKPPGAAIEWHVCPREVAVYTDRGILHQLLLNLLRSFLAADASQRGVALEAALEADRVRVAITGPAGIAGAGDEGLRLCRWLAGALGTEIRVAEDGQSGCRADFALPACAGLRKVLIIDDEPPAIELFTSYLHGLGYEVAGETRAEGALRRAVEVRPDAIVLDVMMPGMDGWELLQQLRQAPELQDVPILACSVLDEAALAAALGAAGFLKKPVLRQQLVGALQELLSAIGIP